MTLTNVLLGRDGICGDVSAAGHEVMYDVDHVHDLSRKRCLVLLWGFQRVFGLKSKYFTAPDVFFCLVATCCTTRRWSVGVVSTSTFYNRGVVVQTWSFVMKLSNFCLFGRGTICLFSPVLSFNWIIEMIIWIPWEPDSWASFVLKRMFLNLCCSTACSCVSEATEHHQSNGWLILRRFYLVQWVGVMARTPLDGRTLCGGNTWWSYNSLTLIDTPVEASTSAANLLIRRLVRGLWRNQQVRLTCHCDKRPCLFGF